MASINNISTLGLKRLISKTKEEITTAFQKCVQYAEIEEFGYQTAAQVDTAITSKGYQTETQVNAIVKKYVDSLTDADTTSY